MTRMGRAKVVKSEGKPNTQATEDGAVADLSAGRALE